MYPTPIYRHLVPLSVKMEKVHSDGISRNLPRERMRSTKRGSRRDLFYIEEDRKDKCRTRNAGDAKGRRCKRTLLPEQLGIPHGNAPFLVPALSPFFHDGCFVSWKSRSRRSRKFQRLHIKAPPPFSRPLPSGPQSVPEVF